MPARQAYMIELVGREDLSNAIGMNSTIFNLARIIGPSIGGIMISAFGIAVCFFINGITYLAVIYQLIKIDTPFKIKLVEKINLGFLIQNMKDGIRYVLRSQSMKYIFLLFMILGIFALNFSVLNPVIAKNDFQRGAAGLSIIMTSMGIGALAGALSMMFLKQKRPALSTIWGIGSGFALSQILLGLSQTFELAYVFMAFTGFFMVLFSTMVNSRIQLDVDDAYRGRIVSFYVFTFVGVAPIGSIYAGWISSAFSGRFAFLVSGIIAMLATFLVWTRVNKGKDLIRTCKKIGKIMVCMLDEEKTWSAKGVELANEKKPVE